jgi:8-oxo-dGTP pyrophosphatase MutT (NUDIX family)
MILPWRHESSTELVRTSIFTLNAHRRSSQVSAATAEFYVLDFPEWVNVVAVTGQNEVVLVEQYRHGTAHATLEIPGGMVDPGETPAEAARRELLEETGFVADEWVALGVVEPNPATQSNRCHTFLARNARKLCNPAPDKHEEIEVQLQPAARVFELTREGRIVHALVIAALFWWQARMEGAEE